jgi:alanine racemase
VNYSIQQIASAIKAEVFHENTKRRISNIVIDSRNVGCNEETLFFALVGPSNNGHQFIEELINKGVTNFVVSDRSFIDDKANYFLVNDTQTALQDMAIFHRVHFNIPVIGITGSNGKTIVKEWLSASLENVGFPVKTIGSFNSQVGVPLSVFQMNKQHTIAIFEAGISMSGEMSNLQAIIEPTIGILTNIGAAHDVGFPSREDKIKEKIRLFKDCQLVICNEEVAVFLPSKKLFVWGEGQNVNVKVRLIGDNLSLSFNQSIANYTVPFTDSVSLENLMQVLAYHIWENQSVDDLQGVITQIHPVGMRLEVKNGILDSLLIDDTYNNDPEGMKRAISFLADQDKRLQRSAIISGYLSNQGDYNELNNELEQANIQYLYLIGKEINTSFFTIPSKSYKDVAHFLNSIETNEFQENVILIKGARKYRFERIVEFLQKEFHETVLEVNLSAIQHNLNYFRSKLVPDTKVMAMVKAYAYGAGATTIARLMEYNRLDYLGVAYVDEGVELRSNGIETPIMVMNPTEKSISKFLEFDLEPEIYSLNQLEELLQSLNGRALKIHLKIDTGMHRLGFVSSEIEELLTILLTNSNLEVASVFTHLATADNPKEDEFTLFQLATFQSVSKRLKEDLPNPVLCHVLNSAGIQRFPKYQFDMVRLGIGLYGVGVDIHEQHQLQHVGVLKTQVSQVKHIPKEETVGYSREGKFEQDGKIATIAIGYADGYDRRFSNGVGKVLVNGVLAPVVGSVCMDMTMIDVSSIDVKAGDEVILFSDELPVTELAENIGTIPYEILTNVSERVKRVFVRE